MNTEDDWMRKLMNCLVCLALMALLFALPMTAIAEDIDFDSFVHLYECGESLGMGIDKSGTLTIFNWDMYDTSAKSLDDIDYTDDVNQWEDWFGIDIVNVVFATKVDYIGAYFFANCDTLTSITLPDTLVEIGAGAFMGCENLTSINLPEGLTTIGADAFYACESLTSLDLPESVTTIGAGAFSDCKGLTGMELPEGVTAIKEYTFSGCEKLAAISLPDNVTSVSANAFQDCAAKLYAGISSKTALALSKASIAFTLPGYEAVGLKVTETSGYRTCSLWRYDANATEIVVPEGVTIIDASFMNNTTLVSITLPESLTSLESSQFSGCTALTTVKLSEKLTSIGSSAFKNCSSLTTVNLPETLTSLATYMFQNCTSLTSITLPENLKSIPSYAFSGCTSLTDVNLPAGVTSLGNGAFNGCPVQWSVDRHSAQAQMLSKAGYTFVDLEYPEFSLKTDVYSNAKFVIVDCKDDVTSVTIPDDMVGIKDNAFSGCTALESITLHDNFEEIGTYAFKDCPATIYANLLTLTATRLPEGSFVVPEYPNLLFSVWCSSAPFNVSNTSVTLIGIREHTDVLTVPDVVSAVRASGFADFTGKFCANMNGKAALALTKANLPFSPVECLDLTITVTGSGSTRTVAVTGCAESATEVVLPEGVTTIAASAFANCPNLKSITLPESLASVNAKAFDGCTALRYAAVGGKAARVLGTKGYTTPDCPQLTLNTTYAGMAVVVDCAADATEIVVPEGVTSIAASAFAECASLTSVTLPEGVTSIGNNAFKGCTALTSVTLPESLKSIDYNAFLNCTSLNSIHLPDHMTSVNNSAFVGCPAARYVNMDSATALTISKSLSFNVPGYEYLDLKATEDADGVRTFTVADCKTDVTSVAFPERVTAIGAYAFEGCAALTSIVIPEGVTSIDNYAFKNCTALASVSLPKSLTSIGSAFDGCTALASLTLPDNLTTISRYIFDNFSTTLYAQMDSTTVKSLANAYLYVGFTDPDYPELTLEVRKNNDNTLYYYVTGCKKDAVNVVIPDAVTYIGYGAFENCSSLKSVNIPDGVTSIGDRAFSGCSSLTGITIPEGVTEIGSYAFSGCSSLTSIVLTEGIKYLNNEVFKDCTSLTSVTVPSSIERIYNDAFENCTSLASITLPDNITTFSAIAFDGCTTDIYVTPESTTAVTLTKSTNYTYKIHGYPELFFETTESAEGVRSVMVVGSDPDVRDVIIPEGTNIIGYNAFEECANLRSVKFPAGLTEIRSNAFNCCSSLTVVDIPEGVTTIGGYAFNNCYNLLRVSLPESLTAMGDRAFSYCSKLDAINLPAGLASMGSAAFYNCKALTTINIPGSLKTIPEQAFYYTNVSTITIEEGVESIDWAAFNYSGASKVYLPNSVTQIDSTAFYNNKDLTIYCYEYSYAESWSVEKKYKHILLDGKQTGSYATVSMPKNTIVSMGIPVKMNADIFPAYEGQQVTWTSGNTAVATISADGVVTPVNPGIATITVTAEGKSASGTVTVAPAITELTLPDTVYAIAKTSTQVPLVLNPANAAHELEYSISDTTYAKVNDSGLISASAVGETTIEVLERVSGKVLRAKLRITYPVSSVSFAEPVANVPLNGSKMLTANVTMRTDSCVNQLVTFSSSNESVAKVDQNGYVTGVRLGTATITATAASGVSATCTVTVVKEAGLAFPAMLEVIEDEAFMGVAFESVTLRQGCTAIGSRAFAQCAGLNTIYVPDSVKSIADDAFEGCSGLTIVAPQGSFAHTFAESHGINWRGN